MNRFFVVFFAALLCLSVSFVGKTQASILNFDDLAEGFIPSNYGGFSWDSNFEVLSTSTFGTYGNTYGATSGDKMVYNAFGVLSVATTSNSIFDFVGAQFTTFALNDQFASFSSTSITVEGWLNGVLKNSTTMNLSSSSFDYLAANFTGIDELRFINDGQNERWWLMDDFEFQLSAVIPEPGSFLVWGVLALAGVGMTNRRRKS